MRDQLYSRVIPYALQATETKHSAQKAAEK